MAGNVREWLWNSAGDGKRHNLGGAWDDPNYFFTFAYTQSPWDRLPSNGFRLAEYPSGYKRSEPAWKDAPLLVRDYSKESPVSDEVFEYYKSQFQYDSAPLDVQIEAEEDGP